MFCGTDDVMWDILHIQTSRLNVGNISNNLVVELNNDVDQMLLPPKELGIPVLGLEVQAQ